MGESLLLALGLALLIEGLLPFVAPGQWRATIQRVAAMRDGQIRFMGMAAILLGLLLITL
jgi:uncharacterized protein